MSWPAMFAKRWRICFELEALRLEAYPFPRGTRSRRIPVEALREVCVGWFPPTFSTREGEFLFVPAEQARALADFASRHGVPFVERFDVWSFLLEPFLDTEFSPELEEGNLRCLEENGVSRAEAQAIRKRVEKRMLALTTATWEWEHYGFHDVLTAMRPFTFTTGVSFARFYDEAMQLAERGRVRPATREDFLRRFPSPET